MGLATANSNLYSVPWQCTPLSWEPLVQVSMLQLVPLKSCLIEISVSEIMYTLWLNKLENECHEWTWHRWNHPQLVPTITKLGEISEIFTSIASVSEGQGKWVRTKLVIYHVHVIPSPCLKGSAMETHRLDWITNI